MTKRLLLLVCLLISYTFTCLFTINFYYVHTCLFSYGPNLISMLCRLVMAPSKKSKKANSAPNKTASNLLKALKRNNSIEKVPMEKKANSCPLDSSPESVKKKPISKILEKKISKKRKRADKPVPCKQEGLKLLQRGAVTMHRIVRRKMLGIKHPVFFNAKGELAVWYCCFGDAVLYWGSC